MSSQTFYRTQRAGNGAFELNHQTLFFYLGSVKESGVIVTKDTPSSATVIVVSPPGEGLSDSLRKAFTDLLASNTSEITLDLEGVQVLHTTVLGSIVFACRQLQKTNGRLALVHVSPTLREIFCNLSLDKLVEIRA